MSQGELLSLLINLGVGLYFAHFYPRSLKKRLGDGRIPPLFALLQRVVPVIGWLLIIGSLGYILARLLFGDVPA